MIVNIGRKSIFLQQYMRKVFFLLFIVFAGLSVQAQLDVGVFAGGSYYMGDLNPNTPFLQMKPAYGVLGRLNINSRWAARVHFYKGVLTSDDKVSNFLPDRSLSFKSGINELAGVMEFHFLPYQTGSMKYYWTPYLMGGVALLYHRPQLDEKDLKDFGTEGQNNQAYLNGADRPQYGYFAFSIPFGVGVKYSFSEKISTSLEWGMRKTFTDYLDDVSTTYYLPSNLDPSNPDYINQGYSDPNRNHEPLMQRGNSQTTDWYAFVGITLTYYIDLRNRNKCSDFELKY